MYGVFMIETDENDYIKEKSTLQDQSVEKKDENLSDFT